MKVVLTFDYDADIIDCPDFIAQDIKRYQMEFDKWLYDRNNDHPFWIYEDGKKYGCQFGSDAFVYWLNTVVLAEGEDQATLVELGLVNYPKDLPIIHF